MIQEDARYLFVHVMKTGGTSLHRAMVAPNFPGLSGWPRLRQRSDDDAIRADVDGYTTLDALIDPPYRSEEIRIWSGHLPLAARELLPGDVSVLTMLRDPVARALSHVRHLSSLIPRYRNAPLEAVYEDEWLRLRFLDNHQTKMLGMTLAEALTPEPPAARLGDPFGTPIDGLTRPLTAPLRPTEAHLERAVAALPSIELLGLTDHLDALVDRLVRHHGWTPRPLGHNRPAGPSAAPSPPSESLLRALRRDNELDLELWHAARAEHRRRRGPRRWVSRRGRTSGAPPTRPRPAADAASASSRTDDVALVAVGAPASGLRLIAPMVATALPAASRWTPATSVTDPLVPLRRSTNAGLLAASGGHGRPHARAFLGHWPLAAARLVDGPKITAVVIRHPVDRVLAYLDECSSTNPEHLGLDLEAIYDDPWFHRRLLRNTQTKALSMSLTETVDPGVSGPLRTAYDQARAAGAEHDEALQHAMELPEAHTARGWLEFAGASLAAAIDVDESRLEVARRVLDGTDVVGTYRSIEALGSTLADRTGWHGAEVGVPKAQPPSVSASFRRRIEEDNELDLVLWEAARERAPS